MPEYLSIRERQERRIAAIVAAVTDVAACHRRAWLGEYVEHLHAYLWSGGEQASPDGFGTPSGATTTIVYSMSIAVCIAQSADAETTEAPAVVYNRMLARLKAAVMADPELTDDDDNTEPLANTGDGVQWIGSNDPPLDTAAGEFFIEIEIEIPYAQYRDNPYAGPGITARTAD